MANKSRFLRLHSLVAFLHSERDGDEIFLKHKGEKVAPADATFYKMPQGQLELGLEIELDSGAEWVELELWEHDILSANDKLGIFKLKVDEVSDDFTAELIRKEDEKTRYVLNWGVVEKMNRRK